MSVFQWWWKKHAHRVACHEVKLLPESRAIRAVDPMFRAHRVLNSFNVGLHRPDPHFEVNMDLITPMLDHLRVVWARGDPAVLKWLVSFFSHIVRFPERKKALAAALVVSGALGTYTKLIHWLFTCYSPVID